MTRETFRRLPPERQEKILDGAAKVFARNGVHRANVAEICRTAGISNGALYKYFKNKEELFLSVVEHGIDLMLHELFGKFTTGGASFSESLEALFRGFDRFLKRHRPYVELYADLTSCSMNKFSGHVAEKIEREGRNLFLQLVEEGKRRGEIDGDLRSDLTVHFLDSQMTLYAYSLVSEYHDRRFNAFFRTGARKLTDDDKIAAIVESARSFLRGSNRPAGRTRRDARNRKEATS